jgi:hypothetical protein
MKHIRTLYTALALVLCTAFLQAQEEATITVKKSDTLNISIKPFAGPDAAIAGKVVSNELDLFYGRSLRERLPLLQTFEHITDATYTGLLKPDPQAYLGCLRALGLAPDDAVFVDDQDRNVDGARRLGIPTVAFDVTRPEASCAMARQMLRMER